MRVRESRLLCRSTASARFTQPHIEIGNPGIKVIYLFISELGSFMIRHDSVLSAPTAKAEDLDEATPSALPLCNGSNGCYPPRRRRRLSASPFTRYAARKDELRYLISILSHISPLSL